jgi:hypothetical protein
MKTYEVLKLRHKFGINHVHVNRDTKHGHSKPVGKLKW